MRIGSLAHATGTSPRCLRHYEKAGLIQSGRLANRYRDYPPEAVTRVRTIRTLLAHGFTLAQIRPLMRCATRLEQSKPACPQMLNSYKTVAATLRQRAQTLADLASTLDREHRRLQRLSGANTNPQSPKGL